MAWQRSKEGYPRVWMEFVCEKTKQKFVVKDLTPEYYDITLGYMTNLFLNESAICKPLKMLEDAASRQLMQQKWLKVMRSNTAIVCCTADEEVPRVAAVHLTTVREKPLEQSIPKQPVNKYDQFTQVVEELTMEGDPFQKYGDKLIVSLGMLVLPEFRGLGIATQLLQTRLIMSSAFEFRGTIDVFSTVGGQAAARKAGYDTLATREFMGQNLALMGAAVAE